MKRKRGSVSGTLGGIIVGFDQQIFRTTPPVQELVAKARPVRGLSGQDGGEFEVLFPDEVASDRRPEGSGEDDPGMADG